MIDQEIAAGRALDFQIALKVLGWTRQPDETQAEGWWWNNHGDGGHVPDHYSTDIAAAFQVAERIKQRCYEIPFGYRNHLNNCRGLRLHDVGNNWIAHFVDDREFDWEGDWIEDTETYPGVVKCSSAPLAICLAALQAVERG